MKKLLSIILLVAMLTGLCASSLAEDDPYKELTEMGVTLYSTLLDAMYKHYDETCDESFTFVSLLQHYTDALVAAYGANTTYAAYSFGVALSSPSTFDESEKTRAGNEIVANEATSWLWKACVEGEISIKDHIEYLRSLFDAYGKMD